MSADRQLPDLLQRARSDSQFRQWELEASASSRAATRMIIATAARVVAGIPSKRRRGMSLFLCGSQARGCAVASSDVDVLVLSARGGSTISTVLEHGFSAQGLDVGVSGLNRGSARSLSDFCRQFQARPMVCRPGTAAALAGELEALLSACSPVDLSRLYAGDRIFKYARSPNDEHGKDLKYGKGGLIECQVLSLFGRWLTGRALPFDRVFFASLLSSYEGFVHCVRRHGSRDARVPLCSRSALSPNNRVWFLRRSVVDELALECRQRLVDLLNEGFARAGPAPSDLRFA
jgi:hypothetical protein